MTQNLKENSKQDKVVWNEITWEGIFGGVAQCFKTIISLKGWSAWRSIEGSGELPKAEEPIENKIAGSIGINSCGLD